jgi:DNA-binding NarL/FixJ family response regulator
MAYLRALIVEDLDEPRQWLAELLPEALPTITRVDMAESLASAFELLAQHVYDIAIVDWHLLDGTSEALIQQLTAVHPETMVVVATIHDDDAHVFPALRAGATGYILKSQPRSVVISQLHRIEMGEPALSPSIAMRMLKHFTERGVHALAQSPSAVDLTAREVDVLRLIAKGYKAPEVGHLLAITTHTVSGYIRDIYRKLGITSRAEATLEASRRGLVA